jgi:hypothetical protein
MRNPTLLCLYISSTLVEEFSFSIIFIASADSSNIKSLNLLFSGEKITFVDYYKRQYNIVIKDLKQVSRFAGHGLSLIEIGPNETSA